MQRDVVIREELDTQTQKRRWKVYPPRVGPVKKENTIRWTADGSPVTLFFPDETIFGLSHINIGDKDGVTLEVKREAKYLESDKTENNLYAAYCHNSRTFAEGESNPIIIIE